MGGPCSKFSDRGILLVSSYRVLRSSLHILIEGVPEGLSVKEIKNEISGVPSVQAVHDLHVWNICSGTVSLSAHVVMDCVTEETNSQALKQINQMLEDKYEINHTTIQMENGAESCGSGTGCN